MVVSGASRGWFPERSTVEACVGSSPASWPSPHSSRLVFAAARCVHIALFARLGGLVVPVGQLVFGQHAVLGHDEARQASWRAAPRRMWSDSCGICQRSLTCRACGAPLRIAEAYSEEPSNLPTSTEGCCFSQAATLSTERSGSRSMGRPSSRSQISVPYRSRRLCAQSSTPITRGEECADCFRRRTKRKMVSRLPLRPCSLPASAPAWPPTLRPSWQRASCSRLVRCA